MAILFLRLFLTGIFLAAATAKLADLSSAEESAKGFGIPSRVARVSIWLVIVLELTAAVLLVFVNPVWFGALLGFALLLLFTIAIVRLLVVGDSNECYCFGQIAKRQVGLSELIRNLVLLGLSGALFVLGDGGLSLLSNAAMPNLEFVLVSTALMLTFLVMLFAHLWINSAGRLKEVESEIEFLRKESLLAVESKSVSGQADDLPIGVFVPAVSLESAGNPDRDLGALTVGSQPSVLFFVGPNCQPCEFLRESIPVWSAEEENRVRFSVISNGSFDDNVKTFGKSFAEKMYLAEEAEMTMQLRAKWTPSAVVVSREGRIASRLVFGDEAIKDLVGQVAEDIEAVWYGARNENESEGFGELAGDVELSRLDGTKIDSEALFARDTMLIFWSLNCHFCTELIDEIKSWVESDFGDKFLIFADGDVEDLRKSGIGDVLIHDPGFLYSKSLGMRGTPSALIVDSNGVIVSETVAGAERIRLLKSHLR